MYLYKYIFNYFFIYSYFPIVMNTNIGSIKEIIKNSNLINNLSNLIKDLNKKIIFKDIFYYFAYKEINICIAQN